MQDFCRTYAHAYARAQNGGGTGLNATQFTTRAYEADPLRNAVFEESTPTEPTINILWTTCEASCQLQKVPTHCTCAQTEHAENTDNELLQLWLNTPERLDAARCPRSLTRQKKEDGDEDDTVPVFSCTEEQLVLYHRAGVSCTVSAFPVNCFVLEHRSALAG